MNKFLVSAISFVSLSLASGLVHEAKADGHIVKNDAFSVFDSEIYAPLFSNDKINAIFNDENLVRNWLKVEAALATAQGRLGIIPKSAAKAINEACKVENIDFEALGTSTAKVGRGISGMLGQIRKQGQEVKDYLHLGSTTQDIMDTATSLQIKEAITVTKANLQTLILALNKMAYEHRNTVMIARTNGQDGVPTTFGLYLITFIGELDRHYTRLEELEERIYIQMGSTVGTLAPYGDKGLKLREYVADELDLEVAIAPWNPSRDSYAETLQTLSLITSTLGRLGTDVNILGRNQIAEIAEGEGGASSTMPHKRNPRAAEYIVSFSYYGEMYASAANDIMQHTDIRQGAPWILEWSVIPESFMVTNTALERSIRLVNNLIVNKENMLKNFDASYNFVMSEAVMNYLTAKMGRADAYDEMKKAIKAAPAGTTLEEILKGNPQFSAQMTAEEMKNLLDPSTYVGSAEEQVEDAYKMINRKYD